MKRQAVKGCIASEEWLSAGPERFTKHVFAVGYPSGSVPGALLLLPPKLPDVPACAGGCQAGLQLL